MRSPWLTITTDSASDLRFRDVSRLCTRLGHVGDGSPAGGRQYSGSVPEHPAARVQLVLKSSLRDGVDLTPGAFAQHASLLHFALRQAIVSLSHAYAHVRRNEVARRTAAARRANGQCSRASLVSGGGEPPRTVRHGDVVLRIQRVVTLFAGADDDVRLRLATCRITDQGAFPYSFIPSAFIHILRARSLFRRSSGRWRASSLNASTGS